MEGGGGMGGGGGGGSTGAGGGGQRFCLRWNNHQTNLLSVFDQLLHDEAFVDVTLAVEGQFLRAHKMVLSACSPLFQALFVGHPDKHPIVILKDVPYSDMRSLLDFMYRGEVSVDQDRLTAFLKVAESLRIKGLTEVNEERCDLPSIAKSLLNQPPFSPPPPPAQQHQQPPPSGPPPNLHRLPMTVGPPPPNGCQPLRSSVRPPLHHHHHPQQQHPNPPSSQQQMLNAAAALVAASAPKRKRGRPRKLSGSSPNPPHSSELDQEEVKPLPPSISQLENHFGLQFPGVTLSPVTPGGATNSGGASLSICTPNTPSEPATAAVCGPEPTFRNCLPPSQPGTAVTSTPVPVSNPPPPVTAQQPPPPPDPPAAASRLSPKMEQGEDEEEHPCKMEEGEEGCALDEDDPPDGSCLSIKSEEPKPGTSGQDGSSPYHGAVGGGQNTPAGGQTDSGGGERFPSSGGGVVVEECLSSVSVSICEEEGEGEEADEGLDEEEEEGAALRRGPARTVLRYGAIRTLVGGETGAGPGQLSPGDDQAVTLQFQPHFLSGESLLQVKEEPTDELGEEWGGEDRIPPRRRDLLEYLMNGDGTVVCKKCGELFPSRTQWYRHKYKFHIESPSPAPLFKCYRCNIFFKSRKGYHGHLAAHSRQSEEQITVLPSKRSRRPSEDLPTTPEDYEKQRELEEKLVADIIDRVKRECEAQGSTVTRKGYSRRSTVMNT